MGVGSSRFRTVIVAAGLALVASGCREPRASDLDALTRAEKVALVADDRADRSLRAMAEGELNRAIQSWTESPTPALAIALLDTIVEPLIADTSCSVRLSGLSMVSWMARHVNDATDTTSSQHREAVARMRDGARVAVALLEDPGSCTLVDPVWCGIDDLPDRDAWRECVRHEAVYVVASLAREIGADDAVEQIARTAVTAGHWRVREWAFRWLELDFDEIDPELVRATARLVRLDPEREVSDAADRYISVGLLSPEKRADVMGDTAADTEYRRYALFSLRRAIHRVSDDGAERLRAAVARLTEHNQCDVRLAALDLSRRLREPHPDEAGRATDASVTPELESAVAIALEPNTCVDGDGALFGAAIEWDGDCTVGGSWGPQLCRQVDVRDLLFEYTVSAAASNDSAVIGAIGRLAREAADTLVRSSTLAGLGRLLNDDRFRAYEPAILDVARALSHDPNTSVRQAAAALLDRRGQAQISGMPPMQATSSMARSRFTSRPERRSDGPVRC